MVSNAHADAMSAAVASAVLSGSHCALGGVSTALRQRTLQYPKPALLPAEVTSLGRPIKASDSNRTMKSDASCFIKEHQARQSRLAAHYVEREIQPKGDIS